MKKLSFTQMIVINMMLVVILPILYRISILFVWMKFGDYMINSILL